MSTLIDDAFSNRCSVGDSDKNSDKNETPDYGAADTTAVLATASNDASKYGYGDEESSPKDVSNLESSEYQYGDTSDLGYGSTTQSSETNPYGYGEEKSSPAPAANGDASNVYGYGDTSDLGYGSTTQSSETNPYGYGEEKSSPAPAANGDASNVYGYTSQDAQPSRRRDRPRRRGSVTKYSLDELQDVQNVQEQQPPPRPTPPPATRQEFIVDPNDMIYSAPLNDESSLTSNPVTKKKSRLFRNRSLQKEERSNQPSAETMQKLGYVTGKATLSLTDSQDDTAQSMSLAGSSDDGMSFDGSADTMSDDCSQRKTISKKKSGRLARFRRNASSESMSSVVSKG
jgi:hypothetical protein